MLWRQPLFAIPLAFFFGTIYGGGWKGYVRAYGIALVFAFSVGLVLWLLEFFILPRIPARPGEPHVAGVIRITATYMIMSMFGAALAALIVNQFVFPGFLGSGRMIVTFLMYMVMLTLIFGGIALAMVFYRDALQRVRSDEELNLARRIQRSFLISQFPSMPRVEVHAVNVSSRHVSGDFYDVVPAGERALLLAIADVAGKGVPAALLSSMLQAGLRTQANAVPSAAAILANINALTYRSSSVHQFATFFLARLSEDTLELKFSNAGHNFPVVFHADGTRETLEKGGTVVGILEAAHWDEGTVQLRPGDRLVLYTDGISEAENPEGELFGEDRLYALIEAQPRTLTANQLAERILAGVREWLDGAEAGDDMTVMVVRVLDSAA